MDGWILSVHVVTSSEDSKQSTKATPRFIFPRVLQWHLISRIYTPIIPSPLRFLNKPDPIHCAKSYLDQCRQPRGRISWSLTRAVWVTSWGNDAQTPGFSCWRCCFPLRSRAVTQNVLLVWQGVKGSRLHLPVEGKPERGEMGFNGEHRK